MYEPTPMSYKRYRFHKASMDHVVDFLQTIKTLYDSPMIGMHRVCYNAIAINNISRSLCYQLKGDNLNEL